MKGRSFFVFGLLCLVCFLSGCSAGEPDKVTPMKIPIITPTSIPLQEEIQVTPPSRQSAMELSTRSVDGVTMVHIPGGVFMIGSTQAEIEDAISLCKQFYSPCNAWYYERESPLHLVTLDAFWIDQTEVTNAQYSLCVEAGICEQPSICKKGEPTYDDPEKVDHPVVCVDWQEAQTYCQWVGARLPTEAEWEYSFRGATGSIYPWGDEFDGSRLNYCDQNCSQSHADERFNDGYPLTSPVGIYPSGASWAGVLDMGGNVSEWVADWLGDYSQDALSNPLGPESGSEKMIKGCNWSFHPTYCRGAIRPSVSPDTRFDNLGFRCVMPVDSETQQDNPDLISVTLEVPVGQPPVLDGSISSGEWDDALIEAFADESKVLLMQDGEFLYLGIRNNETGPFASNVFIQIGDEIAILHSSAALGTATYEKREEGWTLTQDFSWRCRDTGNSEAAQAGRSDFFQDEGWLASNGRMGTPGELEYKIEIPVQDFRIAAVYIKSTPPYEKVPWPASLKDDCVRSTPDGLPEILYYSPDRWISLVMSP